MTQFGGAARLVCGRWTKWIVLAVWIVLFMTLGSQAGKLTDAQQNDTAAWLPSAAQSTQVSHLQQRFQATDVYPAVVLYERGVGTTPTDLDKIKADAVRYA